MHQGLDAVCLADLMANSAAGLMTGGMIVFEALAVGLPAVVFPNVENLIPEVNWFATHGFVRDLGYDGAMAMDQVRDGLDSLLSNRDVAVAQSAGGRRLVDGLGMQRVAQAIEEFLAA
jgi:spore coat polysaccharide biosynthesis predicted glycosyltransferase SpsG